LVEGGKSAAEAEATVKTALGLRDGIDLTNFDPFAAISDANASVSADAQAVLAKQTQLQVLVHTAAVTVAGADAGTDVTDTMSSVFDAIVTNFDGATDVNLSSNMVATATKGVADTLYSANDAARIATKTVADSAAATAVRNATSAEQTITSGNAAQAIENLNAAITMVNTTTQAEIDQASADAVANALALSAQALKDIEAAQIVRDEAQAKIVVA